MKKYEELSYTDKKYKEECRKISEQIKPSDEFIERVKANVEKAISNKNKSKK